MDASGMGASLTSYPLRTRGERLDFAGAGLFRPAFPAAAPCLRTAFACTAASSKVPTEAFKAAASAASPLIKSPHRSS